MKIAIAASARFHLVDLARELAAQGHDVAFYSYIPASRCRRFGLARKYVRGCFWLSSLVELAARRLPPGAEGVRRLREFNDRLMDFSVSLQMRRCDVFIAVSGVYVRALKTARRRYGATVLLERGCKHIIEQDAILRAIPGARHPSAQDIRRELAGYDAADYVVIASEHVRRSFLKHGFTDDKLFINPYGVSLTHFAPTPAPGAGAFDVLMVGTWSYQKGTDVLAAACLDLLKVRLLHVGSRGDCPLPAHPLFTHVDAVDEFRLREYYARARVFALPSRQDGFGLVLGQALACGLPIVCSADTGGSELARFLKDTRWIKTTPGLTPESLAATIREALSLAATQPEGKVRDYAGAAVDELSWRAYGRRYDELLRTLEK